MQDILRLLSLWFNYVPLAADKDKDGELFLVGATGRNYGNTTELNVMSYKQAMRSIDKAEWDKAIEIEHEKMKKYNDKLLKEFPGLPSRKGESLFSIDYICLCYFC